MTPAELPCKNAHYPKDPSKGLRSHPGLKLTFCQVHLKHFLVMNSLAQNFWGTSLQQALDKIFIHEPGGLVFLPSPILSFTFSPPGSSCPGQPGQKRCIGLLPESSGSVPVLSGLPSDLRWSQSITPTSAHLQPQPYAIKMTLSIPWARESSPWSLPGSHCLCSLLFAIHVHTFRYIL